MTFNFDKLQPRQQETLGRIAINDDTCVAPATARALIRKGLIEEYRESVPFAGAMRMSIKRYRVPIAVHIAWCRWCAENAEPLEDIRKEIGHEPTASSK